MPMPLQIAHATEDYDQILADVSLALDLTTRNQAYTVIEAVLMVFRRRLLPDQILSFADLLPPVLRAIFVAGWSGEEFKPIFGSRVELTREVQSLRRHHNFAPEGAIEAVAVILRRHIDEEKMDRLLAKISPEAEAYWVV